MAKSAVSLDVIQTLNEEAVQQLLAAHKQRTDEPLVLAIRYNLDDPDGHIHMLEVLDRFPGPDDDELLVTEFGPSANLLILGTLHLALGSPAQVHSAAKRGDATTVAAQKGKVVFDDGSAKAAKLKQELGCEGTRLASKEADMAQAEGTKPTAMTDETLYQSIAKQSEQLGYRNKLRLAQLLIQLARKEEEENHPQKRVDASTKKPTAPETIGYVAERIVKLRPGHKSGVLNAIGAMFQFRGGVSDQEKETIIKELVRRKVLAINADGRVTYACA